MQEPTKPERAGKRKRLDSDHKREDGLDIIDKREESVVGNTDDPLQTVEDVNLVQNKSVEAPTSKVDIFLLGIFLRYSENVIVDRK